MLLYILGLGSSAARELLRRVDFDLPMGTLLRI